MYIYIYSSINSVQLGKVLYALNADHHASFDRHDDLLHIYSAPVADLYVVFIVIC